MNHAKVQPDTVRPLRRSARSTRRKRLTLEQLECRRLLATLPSTAWPDLALPSVSLTDREGAPASFGVILISDTVDQAHQILDARMDDAVAVVVNSASMSTDELVQTLEGLSQVRGGAPISHLALVAHGAPGQLAIGTEIWDQQQLIDDAAAFARLNSILTEEARLDLYGCSVAYGEVGQAFIEQFATVTGATVFASDNAVGSGPSGDFTWEVQTASTAESAELLSVSELENIHGLVLALPTPILTSPANGATNQSLSTLLAWQSVSGANTYRVVVSTSQAALPTGTNNPVGSFVINQTTSGSNLSVNLNPGTKYYWTVRAGNTVNGEGSLWSAQRNFTTASALSAPILTSPANAATNQSLQSTLSWQAVSGANSYRVVVSTSQSSLPSGSSEPSGSFIVNQLTTSTSFPLTLNPGTTYYWTVRAGNTNTLVGSVWSSQRSFTTAAPLSAPILTSPANAATNQSLQTTLTWQAVSGASSYRVLVSTTQSSLPTGSSNPSGSFLLDQTTSGTSTSVTLSPGTTYYWTVRAGNTTTAVGSVWSTSRSFTTAAPLSAPLLTSPANAATNQSLQTTLTWQAVSGASSYRVVVSTSQASLPTGSNEPAGSFVLNELTTNTSYALNLSPGTTYYWTVRAGNTSTLVGSVWSSPRSFTTAAPLSAPVLTSPANAANNQPLQTTLTWQAVSGASSYRVVVSTSQASLPTGANDPSGSFVLNEITTNTSYTLNLSPGTTYYWTVRAGNTSTLVGSVWSSPRSFTTAAPLSAPVLTSPANAANNQPLQTTLTWQAVSGASSYRVVVSTSQASLPTGANDPSGSFVLNEITTNTSYALNLSPGTTYYWTVRAGNTSTAQGSVWSSQRSFTTAAPLSAPVLTSPANAATNQSLETTLTWQAVSGATSYRVVVSTSQASLPTDSNDPSGSFVLNELTTNTSYALNLSPGTTYYWTVRAGNATTAVGSVWSTQYSFTTAAANAPAFPQTVLLNKDSQSVFATSLNAFSYQYSNQHLEGQCTWYVYGRVVELANSGHLHSSAQTLMENSFMGRFGRDAKNWPAIMGGSWTDTATSSLPMSMRVPGQIVVWTGSVHGHVAFVEEVSADKSQYRVSEYNFATALSYTGDKWFSYEGSSDLRLGTFPKFYQLPLPTTTALASPPTLTNPGATNSPGVNLSTTQPTFQWQSVPGATQYDLRIRQMNLDGTPGALVFESAAAGIAISGTSTSYVLPAGILQNNGYYRWSMRTQDANGWGTVYAPAKYFTVNAAAVPAYNQPFLTDAQLLAFDTMTIEQIRGFLLAHGSYFAQPRADVDGVPFDAAQVIHSAAQEHTINPEVLLTTLQKESGAVTNASRPSDAVMRQLMGVSTSAPTAREQLNRAAFLFKSYHESLLNTGRTVSNWQVGVAKGTQDGVVVTPATNAIAGQFTYTPHAGVRWGGTSAGGVSLFAELWQQFNFGGIWADTERPVVTSATADNSIVNRNSNMQLSWTAIDNVSVHHMALYLYQGETAVDTSVYGVAGGNVDGRIALGAENILNSGTGSFAWTVFNNLPLASYRIKVVAWDTAGLSSSGNLDNGTPRTKWIDFSVVNAAPTISNIADVSTSEDATASIASFEITDPETAVSSLVVSGTSSNGALVDNANIIFSGTGSNRTVSIAPASNQSGTTTITITVTDADGGTNSDTFVLTVAAIGDTPQVASITTLEDTLSDAIVINRAAADGDEVSHFRVSGVLGGTLFKNDGVSPVVDGSFITFAEAQAGLKFLPELNSNLPGYFDVESSQDGSTVALQSSKAKSTIAVTPVNDAPITIELLSTTLLENMAGASIGNLVVTDPDAGDAHVHTVDDSRFEVANGLLKLKADARLDYESGSTINLNITATDTGGLQLTQSFSIAVIDLPEMVGDVMIADGTIQRSQVQSVSVTFDGVVNIDSQAFTLIKRGNNGGEVTTQATSTINGSGQTIVVLTFSGVHTRGMGSLVDGYYQLTIDGTKISRAGQLLDINGNGQGGDGFMLGANEADNFFALYGDLNGDGIVGVEEFGQLRNSFGRSVGQSGFNALLDYEGDGVIGIADFGQFRSRFGKPKLLFS